MSAMDIYDSPYFNLNKKMLCFVGLWPYDSKKKVIRTFSLTLIFVSNLPHFVGLIVNISDMDKVVQHLAIFLMITAMYLKHFTLVIAENKMKIVYNAIANNWLMITDEEERKILVKYSEIGRFITVAYTVPEILNVMNPLPIPRSRVYVFEGEFLVENKDDHFLMIYAWESITAVYMIAFCAAIDTMYSVSVKHCSALYSIVTHRLSKLKHTGSYNSQAVQYSSYEWIIHMIKLHQSILSFVDNINDSYSICFFCLTIMNFVAIPANCVIILINWHHPLNLVRYGIIFSVLMTHLFTLFWPGQELIDHSTKLLEDAYSNEWYETSAETKKMLRIFMLRCTRPSEITAGGLVLMNFENFLKVVKTAASYITVLASFR